MICFMGKEGMSGWMEEFMMGIGLKGKWKERESSYGQVFIIRI